MRRSSDLTPDTIKRFCGKPYKKNAGQAYQALSSEVGSSKTTWTFLDKVDCQKRYLISRDGRIFDVKNLAFLKENLERNRVCFLLGQETKSKRGGQYKRYSRIYLLAFHFKAVSPEVLREQKKYRALHIDGNPNSKDLDKIYLVKAAPKNTSLTLRDVFVIRGLRGAATQSAIAENYGVAHSTISNIWHNRTWLNQGLSLEPQK